MKLPLIAAILCTSLALATGSVVAHPGNGNGPPEPKPVAVKKVQDLAADICIAAVRSGAYADKNDDELSDFCKNLAEHILKGPYEHVTE